MSSTCSNDSIIPIWFTGVYLGLQIVEVICLLIKVYTTGEANKKNKSGCKKLWAALKSVRKKRSCYFPFITHIFDQSTDIGVIVEFYLLWRYESRYKKDHDGEDPCEDINGLFVFLAACGALFAYRIVSCILVSLRTKSKKRAFLQFWDLLLFHALYINYKTKSDTPSNPQKWLQMLEAVFESFPQSLIQLLFIIKTQQFNSIVVVSLIFSILSLSNKVISDDSVYFDEDSGKTLTYKNKQDEANISTEYIRRVIWRVFDVLYRLSILVLIWVVMGGLALFCIIGAEACCLIGASYFFKELSAFFLLLLLQ